MANAGYRTVEDIHNEPDVVKFGEATGLGVKKGKQVKKAVKKSFFQKAEIEKEPEDSPVEFLKSLGGLGFLLSVPGAAATVVAIINCELRNLSSKKIVPSFKSLTERKL